MSVKSIAWNGYPAKDGARLLKFYRDVVGLRVDRAYPSEEEAQLVEFDVGNGHWFSLLPENMTGTVAGRAGGVVFEVDDIDAMLERVRPHAKRTDEKPADYPNCRVASFQDPEGNHIGLHQHKTTA